MSNIRTYRVNHAMQMISIPLHSTTNNYHLGNTDEVVDAKGVVQQVTNYYPFGAPYADASATLNPSLQAYKYNGKELELMHGLNTYDYGARQLDPILCRWDRIDPLCEKYYSISPYIYCHNNSVNMIDPDGRTDYFTIYGSFAHHVDDGKNDRMMTFAEKKKNVEACVNNGEVFSISSDNVLRRMDGVYDSMESDGLEHGFMGANINGVEKLSSDIIGKDHEVDLTDAKKELGISDAQITIDVHGHPKDDGNEEKVTGPYGLGQPSKFDTESIGNRIGFVLGYKAKEITNGIGSVSSIGRVPEYKLERTIAVYNSKKHVSIPYERYKKAVEKVKNWK